MIAISILHFVNFNFYISVSMHTFEIALALWI